MESLRLDTCTCVFTFHTVKNQKFLSHQCGRLVRAAVSCGLNFGSAVHSCTGPDRVYKRDLIQRKTTLLVQLKFGGIMRDPTRTAHHNPNSRDSLRVAQHGTVLCSWCSRVGLESGEQDKKSGMTSTSELVKLFHAQRGAPFGPTGSATEKSGTGSMRCVDVRRSTPLHA